MRVSRTARYYTLGKPGPSIRYCWIVCHGYGQLARNFIRKFDVLESEDTLVIAPEGLSRFYWGGVSGVPVASWMTSEGRLEEIEDYTHYLSALYDHFTQQLPDDVQIILLGFSQGVATQFRWITRRLPDYHSMIVWAGRIPEDIDYSPHLSYFNHKPLHFVVGDQDEFLSPERLENYREEVKQHGLNWQEHHFHGTHTVDRKTLKMLEEAYIRK
jgi:predicted esterase